MAQPANIDKIPTPSKERGQRSIPISEAYFARIIPSWSQPSMLTPDQWRAWVKSQPIAVACKETMTSNISDLDWKITPRESDQRDELKGTIKHYEKLLQRGGESGLDWVGFLEWSLEDLLDLPFGSAWEVGRKGDSPDGRVMWLEPIDGGTCYPTNNKDFPVLQYYSGYQATFPKHAVARMYMNPIPQIERKGWGMAPPERIFRAMEMIIRGDAYYANLLLDIPPVGVLDLGDIEWDAANTWIKSFRTAVTAGTTDSFKIPVLAEHTGKVEFIPLGKAPNDIMYDRITLKYASLVTAGYGMNLGDIGVQSASSSGETLAGSIRGEQKTNRTGKARVKKKIKYFWESVLPPMLQFDFIDTDGERLSMLGRARLANATAMNQYREMEAISPEEARLQAIQDGLFTISMPEKPPKEAKKENPLLNQPFGKPVNGKKPPERPGSVGSPQPPSLGGDGEVKKSMTFLPSRVDEAVEKVVSVLAPNIRESLNEAGEDDFEPMKSLILNTVFSQDDELGLGSALNSLMNSVELNFNLETIKGEIEELLVSEGLHAVNLEKHIQTLEERCKQGFPAFLGKAIVYTLVNSERLFSGDVVENVQSKVSRSLADYVSTFVGIELSQLFEEIKETSLEVPETLRLKGIVRKPINQITVEAPQISSPVSVTVPERSVQIGTPEVSVYPPDVTVNFPKQDPSIVNLTIPEQKPADVKVDVTVPERSVIVQSPIVNVNTPEQPVPNVTVQVEPTPIEVRNDVTVQPADVKIPKPIREIQQVIRDVNLNISATDTEIKYDESEE